MASKRERFTDYVKNGGERVICSPQVGGGAGYVAKLHGRNFCSEVNHQEEMAVISRYKMLPLYNCGIDPIAHCKEIKWEMDEHEKTAEQIEITWHCDTPYGSMRRRLIEKPRVGGCYVIHAIGNADELDMFEYVLDTALQEQDFSCYTELGQKYSEQFNGDGAVSIAWCMQPYEMLGYPSTMTTAMLPYDDETRFYRLMDKILALDYKIIDALAKSGADFLFLGGPGSEIASPAYYDKYIVPYSKKVTDHAHSRGMMIYSHICSPIEPMLSKGYYNRMGIDLFETLSPFPEGNVTSIADALSKLDPAICTRGNVSLSLLTKGTPEEIKREVYSIIDAAKGRKHIIAASDCLIYDVPEANVFALCEAVEEYYR